MEENVIETEHLNKRFGLFTAVKDLSLHVPAGSITCFLGPNGAGKTTTIRMLLGLIQPSTGVVRLFGAPPGREALRRVGSLVETPSYYPNLTGWENLDIVRRLRELEPECIPAALAQVGLEKDARRPTRFYSLGMLQRLGLAIALMGNPRLVILDEPTNGLDPAGIHEVRDLLKSLPAESGVTLFVSSHLLSEVEQIATRIGIIRGGCLVFEGSPQELRTAACASLNLRVDRPREACACLHAAGWNAAHIQDHTLSVPMTCDEGAAGNEAARLNAYLVGEGFLVRELTRTQPTLEDIFLQVTQIQSGEKPTGQIRPGSEPLSKMEEIE